MLLGGRNAARTRPDPLDGRPDLWFRAPTPADGAALWALAGDAGLDVNAPYAYLLWGRYFAETSIVAAEHERIVGFVTGFHPPDELTTLFVWQVAVAGDARGVGVGGRMLDELLVGTGARFLEATVSPSNTASAALFRGVADRHGTAIAEALEFPSDLFPDDHEPEIRFRIGPFGPV